VQSYVTAVRPSLRSKADLQQQQKIRANTIKLANTNATASGAMVVHRVIFSTHHVNKLIDQD
jgi:hypothetical protein